MHTSIASSISKISTMWIWHHLGQMPVTFDILLYLHSGNDPNEPQEGLEKRPDDENEARDGQDEARDSQDETQDGQKEAEDS